MSPSLTLGKVFSSNSQTFSNKTLLSKRFLVSSLHFLQDQVKWLVFFWNGLVWPFEKASVSFRHDLAGSPGLSATAHRHQFPFGLLSFKQVGLRFSFTPWRFYHHPSLGCLRPLLVQHYPWPFEPRIFMVRFLSFMYKIFTDISFMCRTFTEIQSRRSISVLLLEQVRTWVGRRLGWGGDTGHTSDMLCWQKSRLPYKKMTFCPKYPNFWSTHFCF